MSKTSDTVKAVLWYFLLLALVPAIIEYWAFLAFPPGPVLRLETPWDTAYSAICVAIFLLFLWRGKKRRLVFSALIFTLFALYLYADTPSLDRILSFVAYSALFGIALEFWRQNGPLYRELKASGVSIGRILLKASLLWSPMLVFVAIGFTLNHFIVESTRNTLYASTLIERHCVIRDDPEKPVIACANLQGRLHRDQLEPLTLDENIEIHVERMFLFWQKKTLERLASLPPDRLNHKLTFEEVRAIEKALKPVNMFGLEAPSARKQVDYRADPRVRALQNQLRAVGGQIDRCRKVLLVFKNRRCEELRRERARLSKEREARVAFLKKQDRDRRRKQQADDPVAAYRGELYRELERTTQASEFRNLRMELNRRFRARTKPPPPEEVRAAIKVAVMRFMSDAQRQAREAFTASLKRHHEVAYDVGAVQRLCRLKGSGEETGSGGEFGCPGTAKDSWVLEPLPLRENIDRSIMRWHERSERDLERRLIRDRLAFAAAGRVTELNREFWASDVIPPEIGLRKQDCGLDPRCTVFNWVKAAAEDAYREARTDLKVKLTKAVNTAARGAASRVNEQIDLVTSGLHEALAELRRRIDSAVENIARGGAVVSALLQLWLLLVIIKSVLYVIATEVFNVRSIPVIGLESQGNAEGVYARSTNIEIPESFATALQTSTVGINQGKRTVIPQPFRAIFARIIHGKWILNRGAHAENATMRFTQPGGRVGIDWQMAEGEEVVFRYRDLLGFSENVELRTTISLRLSTLLFGRYVYHSARCIGGPGRLLLSVKGDVEAEQHKVETFPLERLIAWNMHARFRVTDERTLAAVFKDGFTIRRVRQGAARNGLVLVGAPVSEESHFQGTLRFVKTFLMPI